MLACFTAAATILTSCNINEPVPPVWDTTARFPLTNSQYDMLAFLGRNDSVSFIPGDATNGNVVSYVYRDEFNTFDIGDTLQPSDVSKIVVSNPVEQLKIPSFSISTFKSLFQIFESTGVSLADGTQDIPTINNVRSPLYTFAPLADIEFVTVATGGVTLTITNSTALAFTNLQITITDAANGNLGDILIETLPAQSQAVRTLSLAGKTFSSQLSAQISNGTIPAQNGVAINISSLITIAIAPEPALTFTQARARFAAQSFEENGSIELTGTQIESLDELRLKRGTLIVQLSNALQLSGSVRLRLPTATNPQGATFELNASLPLSGTRTDSLSLAGYLIRTQADKISAPFTLLVSLDASTGFVTVDVSTPLQAAVSAKRLVASYLKGTVKPIVFNLKKEEIRITAFDRIDTASRGTFFDPRITAKFVNRFGIAVNNNTLLNAVNGKRNGSPSVALVVNGGQLSVGVPAQGNAQVRLDTLNSNVSEATSIFPTRLEITGTATLNPNGASGEVYDTNSVALDLEFLLPLRFSASQLIALDTSKIDNAESILDFGPTQLISVEITGDNGLPANAGARVLLLDSSKKALYIDAAKTIPLTFPRGDTLAPLNASPLNAQGFSSGTTTTTTRYELLRQEIELIKKARYSINRIVIDSKQSGVPREIRVRETDKLRFKTVVKIVYRVNG